MQQQKSLILAIPSLALWSAVVWITTLFVLDIWLETYILIETMFFPEFRNPNSGPFGLIGLALFVPCFFAGSYIVYLLEERKEKRRQVEEEARSKIERRLAEQKLILKKLARILSDTQACWDALPSIVARGVNCLDRAETEFSERAFAPFWDAIEDATSALGEYHDALAEIANNAKSYKHKASYVDVSVPEFVCPIGVLPDARPVSTRLERLVRGAQKDFEFATIYEQRRTNQILIAGFQSLSDALAGIGAVIERSLYSLSESLTVSLDVLSISYENNSDILRTMERQSAEQAASRKGFEQAILQLEQDQYRALDNLQRGKKPPA